jgi:hypothetical protein
MTDNDQKLWDLLGRPPRPSAPPFFAAKVMRQVESDAGRPAWFIPVLRWLAPACIAALVVLAVLPRPTAEPAGLTTASDLTTLDLVEMLSPEDYDTLTAAGWPYNNGFLSAGL